MFDTDEEESIAREVVDIMVNGNLDLSDLDFSSLQDFPEEPENDAPSVSEDKKASEVIENTATPAVPYEQSVPNTYKDLHDSEDSFLWVSEEKGSQPLMEQELNQLLELSTKIDYPANVDEIMNALEQGTPVPTPVGSDSVQLKLSFYIDKMPHGIVDKQVAGIGATTLEIDSKRNSILVVPTRVLAYNKWIRNKEKTLYVGGKINEERDTTSIQEIQEYLSDEKIAYKKFLVVADSLHRLLQIIGAKHYKDYFLMIDEVDMIQSESNYRPRLESLIDHYFQFPPKNRCLVTATLREFSNPQLQQECKFRLTWKDIPKRNIRLYYTDNLDALTAQQIQSISQTQKIMVAFNSIRHCKNIIKLLPDEIQMDCAILCSDSSVEEAGVYFAELAEENKLPKRISFITSCYFAGVDIEDSYHLISVSNARKNYQMLSLDKITQIHGRCRIQEGILNDTIIYNTRETWRKSEEGDYQATLLKQAEALLRLQKSASKLGEQDTDLHDLFEIVKTAIREKGAVSISGKESVRLTRKDSFNKDVVAYMNIDYLVERHNLCNTIYNSRNHLRQALEVQGHIVTFENKYGAFPLSEQQVQIEKLNKDELQASIDAQLSEIVEELREITKSRLLTRREKQIYQNRKGCSTFVYRFYQLQEYADADTLLDQLWQIRHSDKRAYKNLRNAAVFWALDDIHPFKRELLSVFRIGEKYKATEIHQLIAPIVKYHLHKTIKQREAVSLIKALYLVERPKTYFIKGINPMEFKQSGNLRIQKTEDNLRKYFQV